MRSHSGYIVSDGKVTIRLGGKSSLHACKNFLRRLNKCRNTPGPVLYVRSGLGGGLEYEAWYFTYQFDIKQPHLFSELLIEQQEEPKFLSGLVDRRKQQLRPSKNKQERHRQKLRLKGLCEICGKERETEFLRCDKCRKRKSRREAAKTKRETVTFASKFEPSITELYGDPTKANPGSEEKLLVLENRYDSGVSLWHPNDYPDGEVEYA